MQAAIAFWRCRDVVDLVVSAAVSCVPELFVLQLKHSPEPRARRGSWRSGVAATSHALHCRQGDNDPVGEAKYPPLGTIRPATAQNQHDTVYHHRASNACNANAPGLYYSAKHRILGGPDFLSHLSPD